jgi:hypothetical protein
MQHVRRNHALEHATISVVTERCPGLYLSGRSNRRGFYVFGRIDTEELQAAIAEALARLEGGETRLAIHPRCGTNLAVAGVLSGLAAAAGAGVKPRQNRVAVAVMASLAALVVAPKIGASAQQHLTTLAHMHGLRVTKVERKRVPFMREPAHWVKTQSGD